MVSHTLFINVTQTAAIVPRFQIVNGVSKMETQVCLNVAGRMRNRTRSNRLRSLARTRQAKFTFCYVLREAKKGLSLLRGHPLPKGFVGGHPSFDKTFPVFGALGKPIASADNSRNARPLTSSMVDRLPQYT